MLSLKNLSPTFSIKTFSAKHESIDYKTSKTLLEFGSGTNFNPFTISFALS